jgi:lipid II isoglutaminyl synthase (glutamine-hydrolysing)
VPRSSARGAVSGGPTASRRRWRRARTSWRLAAAVLAGRAASALSRRLGRGGGTVIAGHVVPRLAPDAIRRLSAALPEGVVLVSGTNGKTTTSRLLAQVLGASGRRVVHNRAGANLLTGIVSALAQAADLRGRPRADVGLFEVDEATLPHALRPTRPCVVVLTNIFRDQLDRYGEVHYVAEIWRRALAVLPPAATLVLNADDPLVASLGAVHPGPILYYGVDLPALATPGLSHAADARLCPRCGAPLAYTHSYYGHLGDYRCGACAFARPAPTIVAVEPTRLGPTASAIQVSTPSGPLSLSLTLPGLYNVYNALAAMAGSLALGVPPATVAAGLARVSAAFGRLERIAVGDRAVSLALVKNPVGCTEVLRTLTAEPAPKTLLVAINDLFADGTDVSWLWDADFELLGGHVACAVCSGTRAADMALRLKYALVPPERLVVEPDVARALQEALARTPAGGTLHVLPTYTALLALRDALRRQGAVAGFWED